MAADDERLRMPGRLPNRWLAPRHYKYGKRGDLMRARDGHYSKLGRLERVGSAERYACE